MREKLSKNFYIKIQKYFPKNKESKVKKSRGTKHTTLSPPGSFWNKIDSKKNIYLYPLRGMDVGLSYITIIQT